MLGRMMKIIGFLMNNNNIFIINNVVIQGLLLRDSKNGHKCLYLEVHKYYTHALE